MKTDLQLQSDVSAELSWDPALPRAGIGIGVAVAGGIVTLSGLVETYIQKRAVERAVRRIAGVRGIANDLVVRLDPLHHRTDTEIAEAALHALNWNSMVPNGEVTVAVEDGWIRLHGEVDYPYQRASAEHAVRHLIGVRGVTNDVQLKVRADSSVISDQIVAALERHARREGRHIAVSVDGGVVTLTGDVDSLGERDAVIGTASTAPGVSRVIDALRIA